MMILISELRQQCVYHRNLFFDRFVFYYVISFQNSFSRTRKSNKNCNKYFILLKFQNTITKRKGASVFECVKTVSEKLRKIFFE